jgi:hypothetical protein
VSDPRHNQAAISGEMAEVFLNDLCRLTGFERYVVLAGVHAVLVDMMTETVGGPLTAAALDRAVARIRNKPSKRALALATDPVNSEGLGGQHG